MPGSNVEEAIEHRRSWRWIRALLVTLAIAGIVIVGLAACLFFSQHSMIYHPRPYRGAYLKALPPNGQQIDYVLPFGRQAAYYIAGSGPAPKRIWIAFCGNGSLALDWTGMLKSYPHNTDGFLLVDYPGYGRNAGYATIDSTRATANAALDALTKKIQISEDRLELCVIGHSLGAAAALDFAVHHSVNRVILLSPFTTLREEAAYVFGPLSRILIESYDNRENLRTILRQNPNARVAIFHGVQDDLIPIEMGRKLKEEFPSVDFFPIEGAEHSDIVDFAQDQIIAWMKR